MRSNDMFFIRNCILTRPFLYCLEREAKVIREGMRMIELQTQGNDGKPCIKFVKRTNQENWVRIQDLQGCWSQIGKAAQKGPQTLSLQNPGCVFRRTVAHEFIHALGFHHEQTRPDRDKWVEVLFENIKESKQRKHFMMIGRQKASVN
jgi:hypothetical protein